MINYLIYQLNNYLAAISSRWLSVVVFVSLVTLHYECVVCLFSVFEGRSPWVSLYRIWRHNEIYSVILVFMHVLYSFNCIYLYSLLHFDNKYYYYYYAKLGLKIQHFKNYTLKWTWKFLTLPQHGPSSFSKF